MKISGRQIRAGRGLLGWSMEDLAHHTGLTTITIRHIESEAVQPQERTLASILTIFDRHSVEFLDEDGVKLRKQQARSYSGKTGYRQLLDHIYDTLREGGRVRQFNFGDLQYLPYADDFVAEHLKRMEEIKDIDARVLETRGESENQLPYCSYRYLDKKMRELAPFYLYNDHLVLPLFDSEVKKEFISIHSKHLADLYLGQFDNLWRQAELPKRASK